MKNIDPALPGRGKPSLLPSANEYGKKILSALPMSSASLKITLLIWNKACVKLEQNRLTLQTAPASFWRDCALSMSKKEHALRLLRLASTVYSALATDGYVDRDYARAARALLDEPLSNAPPAFLSEEQAVKLDALLRSTADDDELRRRDKAMVALCLYAGASPAELTRMTVSCVSAAAHHHLVTFTVPTTFCGEAAMHRRTTPIDDRAQAALVAFTTQLAGRAPQDPAFAGLDRSRLKPIDRTRLYVVVRKLLLEALGYSAEERRQGPQTLRNTWCARMLRAGIPADTIMQRMGWSDIATFYRFRAAWAKFEARCG
ncbi:tyrosine-type recombinase/integrase [Thauera sp.]|jgi:integrase|uniref:tyrosine-type recombinase/integrase n=1 Tax=Thauera sp. TaxID=1905334 RepID=UPI00257DBAD9|nr:tyrosine-type recombinase/integrase [Thauera sp.]